MAVNRKLLILGLLAALVFPACALITGRGSHPASSTLESLSGEKPAALATNTSQPSPQPTDFADLWHSTMPTATPDRLPDYPVPTPAITVTAGPDGDAPDSSIVNRLRIPSMGLDTVVKFVPYENETWLIGGLKQEIAWMGDTSWPGLGGNTGLAGHVDLATGQDGPFWNLYVLEAGDEVFLYTEQKMYTYIVREKKIVADSDMSVLDQTQEPVITLITCTGWDAELMVYTQRLIVVADLKTTVALSQ